MCYRLILALLLSGCALLQPGIPRAENLSQKIQDTYTSIQSFQSGFTQKLTNAASGEVQTRTGTIQFRKPHSIRWETLTPEKELLVVRDDHVWDVFPTEGVAYKYSLEGKFSSKTMLEFLTGEVSLEQDFQVQDQGLEEGLRKVRLVPKNPEPNLVLAYLWLNPEGFTLKKILLVDFFGNGNELAFEDLKLNVSIPDDAFTYSPPEDIQVIDNTE
jgi:outer membrane lipoprotein carrier protein